MTLRFGNQPYGSVLIKKLADDANKTPLAGATFLVTDDKGTFIGTANGEFTTDKSGAIQLPKLPAGTTIVAKEIRPRRVRHWTAHPRLLRYRRVKTRL